MTECGAIGALINEIGDTGIEDIILDSHVFQYPQCNVYFGLEDSEVCDLTANAKDGNKLEQNQVAPCPWSPSLRRAIINHLNIFDINIPLLVDAIEKYRFDLENDELVEIVRILDILGAEKRLSEYEALLFLKLKKKNDYFSSEWERRYGGILPVRVFESLKDNFQWCNFVVGRVGSPRFIEFVLETYPDKFDKNYIFAGVCGEGNLSVAQVT
jgi:hypothetical protein